MELEDIQAYKNKARERYRETNEAVWGQFYAIWVALEAITLDALLKEAKSTEQDSP